MNIADIIKQFVSYTGYDPEQKSFNMLSSSYEFHRAVQCIEKVLELDPTGRCAVLYAKNAFERILTKVRLSVMDYIRDPKCLHEELEMYALFNDKSVAEAKQSLIEELDLISEHASGIRMIGTADFNDAAFCQAIDAIAEKLTKLAKANVYCCSGKTGEIRTFCNRVLVYRTMRDCVLSLEAAPDAVYLCYISDNESLTGYFAYMIKSNGNLFCPVTDRYNEKYPGETSNHPNNRWMEDKGFDIFPYDEIVNFSGQDYKGYCTKATLADDAKDGIRFSELNANVRQPIFMAMLLLANRYSNTVIEGDLSYMTYMLSGERALSAAAENAIIPVNNSVAIANHAALAVLPSDEEIITGAWHKQMKKGSFTNPENIFVSLYGEGFRFDPTPLFGFDSKRLTDGSAVRALPEMVGSEEQIKLSAYWLARKQLALYCQDKVFEELESFGGKKAVYEWYVNALEERLSFLEDLCFEKFFRAEHNEENRMPQNNCYRSDPKNPFGFLAAEKLLDCIGFADKKAYDREWSYHPSLRFVRSDGTTFHGYLGAKYNARSDYEVYREDGHKCNLFFKIQPDTWENMEALLGREVPKVLKGWSRCGHSCRDNDILIACDKCERISTPFENGSDNKHSYERCTFSVVIPFSKIEFNRRYKEWLRKEGGNE